MNIRYEKKSAAKNSLDKGFVKVGLSLMTYLFAVFIAITFLSSSGQA